MSANFDDFSNNLLPVDTDRLIGFKQSASAGDEFKWTLSDIISYLKASQAEAESGANDTRYLTSLSGKQLIDVLKDVADGISGLDANGNSTLENAPVGVLNDYTQESHQFHNALRENASQGKNTNVVMIGDSLTQQVGIPEGLRQRFDDRYGAGGLGMVWFHEANQDGVYWEKTSGVHNIDENNYNVARDYFPSFRGKRFTANGETVKIGVPKHGCDSAIICWVDRTAAGTWRYRATDGINNHGDWTTVNTTSPAEFTARAETVTQLGSVYGRYLIEIESVSSVTDLPIGAVIFKKNSGVSVSRLAQGGLTTADWSGQDRAAFTFWMQQLAPSLAIINLGQNGISGTFKDDILKVMTRVIEGAPHTEHPTATYTSGTLNTTEWYKIQTYNSGDDFSNVDVEGRQGYNGMVFKPKTDTPTDWTNGSTLTYLTVKCSILLIKWWTPTLDSRATDIKELVDETQAEVFDTKALIPNTSYPQLRGFTYDGTHFNQRGYDWLANHIFENKLQVSSGLVKKEYKPFDIPMLFDGSEPGYMILPAPGTSDFSIVFAVRFSEKAGEQTHTILDRFANGANHRVYLLTNKIRFDIGGTVDGSGSNTVEWVNNRWYHIVITRVSGTIYYYLDGEDWGSESMPNSIVNGSNYFGGDTTGSLTLGEIADFKYWERGLSHSEIVNLFNHNLIDKTDLVIDLDVKGSAGYQVISAAPIADGYKDLTLPENLDYVKIRGQQRRKFTYRRRMTGDGYLFSDRSILPSGYTNLEITVITTNATGPTITVGSSSGSPADRVASVVLNGTGTNNGRTKLNVLDAGYDSQKIYIDYTANISDIIVIVTGDIN